MAALVQGRVAEEERRVARERRTPVRRRTLWVRVLATSVFVHAAVIVAILWASPRERASEQETQRSLLANLPSPRIPTTEDLLPPDIPWPRDGALGMNLPDPIFPGPPDVDAIDEAPAPVVEGLPSWDDRLREHPPAVALDMLYRTDETLKRRRLLQLEIDPDGTITRVRRGLDEIAKLQREDGSFPAAAGRTEVGETALAVLPFLGDGSSSSDRGIRHPEKVARGMAWLRRTLFTEPVLPRDPSGGAPAVALRDEERVPVRDQGIALIALAEDYMLSFGRFSPAEAGRRVAEMESLARAIGRRQGVEGGFEGSSEDAASSVWPVWGLYAAARTGTVTLPAEPIERFRRWFDARPRTPEGMPMRADGSADPVLAAVGLLFDHGLDPERGRTVAREASGVVAAGLPERDGNLFVATAGSALLLHDPAIFRSWGRETTDWIAARLHPTGLVREGDPVGDTALVLLALQAAYRTY